MKNRFKPCPFCGGTFINVCETDYNDRKNKAYAVYCRTRDCHGCVFQLGFGLFDTERKAVRAWNKRAIHEPAQVQKTLNQHRWALLHIYGILTAWKIMSVIQGASFKKQLHDMLGIIDKELEKHHGKN